ncbi:CMTM4 family protein [Megaselia abdita]
MAQQGFPGSHTTTTSVTQTTVSPQIRYDPTYIKTIPGILKCACLVLNLVGFICIQCSGALSYHTRGSFFSTISMTGFWFTGIMLILYLIHICEKFYKIPWLKIEMYFDVSWTILYLIASSFAAALGNEAYAAAAFFGFCSMVCYGYDAFLKWKSVQSGEIAQGSRVISRESNIVA